MTDIIEKLREYSEYAEMRSERDTFEATIKEITRLREDVAAWEHDNDVLGKLLSKATAEKETLRERIRVLTEDMPAGDARRILAEQHAEIERLRRLAAGQ